MIKKCVATFETESLRFLVRGFGCALFLLYSGQLTVTRFCDIIILRHSLIFFKTGILLLKTYALIVIPVLE